MHRQNSQQHGDVVEHKDDVMRLTSLFERQNLIKPLNKPTVKFSSFKFCPCLLLTVCTPRKLPGSHSAITVQAIPISVSSINT
jgi:hypothetical protein